MINQASFLAPSSLGEGEEMEEKKIKNSKSAGKFYLKTLSIKTIRQEYSQRLRANPNIVYM